MQAFIKILILEDQLIIAEDTSDMLQEAGYEVVGIAESYDQAVALIEAHKPDLAILDINVLGTKKGTDVGLYINQTNPIPFVYLTSHSDKETLSSVKDTNPSAFLMKPFLRKNLLATIEIALHNFSEQKKPEPEIAKTPDQDYGVVINAHFVFKDGYKHVKLPFEEIMYFQSDGNYVTLKSSTKKYSLRTTMKKVEEQLPSKIFFRSHKQFIINLTKVQQVSSDGATIGKEVLAVGREQKASLIDLIKV